MFDSHCHIDLMENMKNIVESSQLATMGILAVGTTPKAYQKETDLFYNHPTIKVGLGLHPQLIGSGFDDIELFAMLARKCRYIGEVGLDFSNEYISTKDEQIVVFEKVVKICENYGDKVVSLHSLKSVTTVLSIIEANRRCKENIYILHWFTGSITQLKKAIDFGFYFSINPKMTKTRSGQDIIKLIPANHILIETDAPFALKYKNIEQAKRIIEKTVQEVSDIKNYNIRVDLEKTEKVLFI